MSLEIVFAICNYAIVPPWVMLVVAPRWTWTSRVVHGAMPFVLLSIAYAILLFGDRPGPQGAHFFSLDGVTRIFTTPRTIIACWVHYLVGDLFLGAWEARDAERLAIPHRYVIPSLVLTLLFAPVGLSSWLLVRAALRRRISLREEAQPSL
jgi:hypothetical protein